VGGQVRALVDALAARVRLDALGPVARGARVRAEPQRVGVGGEPAERQPVVVGLQQRVRIGRLGVRERSDVVLDVLSNLVVVVLADEAAAGAPFAATEVPFAEDGVEEDLGLHPVVDVEAEVLAELPPDVGVHRALFSCVGIDSYCRQVRVRSLGVGEQITLLHATSPHFSWGDYQRFSRVPASVSPDSQVIGVFVVPCERDP